MCLAETPFTRRRWNDFKWHRREQQAVNRIRSGRGKLRGDTAAWPSGGGEGRTAGGSRRVGRWREKRRVSARESGKRSGSHVVRCRASPVYFFVPRAPLGAIGRATFSRAGTRGALEAAATRVTC